MRWSQQEGPIKVLLKVRQLGVENEGRSDPAPMTAPVLFGMNLSSSQLLDLLQALRLGQFFFFPSFISRLPIKKIYSTAQAFQTPNLAVTQQQK
jgi:hypothetical protein